MLQNVAQFWLVALALIAVCLLAMRWLWRSSGAHWQPARIWKLHRDEVGSVQSLSFVLTLPLFIMIMMGIVQASQLMIAKVVVEYSAIAAARSAAVWIPAHLADYYARDDRVRTEGRNRIGSNWIPGESTGDGQYYLVSDSDPTNSNFPDAETRKTFRIHMAAAQACLAISPSRDTGFGLDTENPAFDATDTYNALVKAHSELIEDEPNPNAIANRLRNKLAYSLANTHVEIRVFHPNVDPDLGQIWNEVPNYDPSCMQPNYQYDPVYMEYMSRPQLGPQPNNCDPMVPVMHRDYTYDAVDYQDNQVDWQDVVSVTVEHNFALIPGPGRMLARFVASEDGNDRISESIDHSDQGHYVWPLKATASATIEAERSVLRYDYHFSGTPY
ncbi:MAG: pilus assembly protein [Planctomycetales bacterium]